MFDNITCKSLIEEINETESLNTDLLKEHINSCQECSNNSYVNELILFNQKIKAIDKVTTSNNFMNNLDKKIQLISLDENKNTSENWFLKIKNLFIAQKKYLVAAASFLVIILLFNEYKYINSNNQQILISKKSEKPIKYNNITEYMINMDINTTESKIQNHLKNNESGWILYNQNL